MNTGTSTHTHTTNHNRRQDDGTIRLPQWVAPFLLTGFVIASGLWVKDIAAQDTDLKLIPIEGQVEEHDDRINDHEKQIALIQSELTQIKEVADKAQRNAGINNRLLVRIADKMDVRTDDIEYTQ